MMLTSFLLPFPRTRGSYFSFFSSCPAARPADIGEERLSPFLSLVRIPDSSCVLGGLPSPPSSTAAPLSKAMREEKGYS